eukprot:COSAG02_NODE_22316_length_756_cov_1.404871_1_plen_87_part_10
MRPEPYVLRSALVKNKERMPAAACKQISPVVYTNLGWSRQLFPHRQAPRLNQRLDFQNELQSQRYGHHRLARRGVDLLSRNVQATWV